MHGTSCLELQGGSFASLIDFGPVIYVRTYIRTHVYGCSQDEMHKFHPIMYVRTCAAFRHFHAVCLSVLVCVMLTMRLCCMCVRMSYPQVCTQDCGKMVCSGTTLLAHSSLLLYRLHRGVTDSINDLLSVLSSAAPGQKECDDALRKITVSRTYTHTYLLLYAEGRNNYCRIRC